MITNHNITLYVNDELLELVDQDSINIRLNNVLFDPESTKTSQATYSFTFNVPSTPNNNKIFGFANAIDKTNKFNRRYSAKLYADEILIFEGTLVVKEYNYQDEAYSCNLVSLRVLSLEEIFGDDKLCDVEWEVEFSGATSINEQNGAVPSNRGILLYRRDPFKDEYYFPLVSYGVFPKKPKSSDEVGNEYTSKFVIDQYNRWYIESFYPSLKVLSLMKRAFEQKGYKVIGNAFGDPVMSNVYASVNLSSEQIPLYNLGNPMFGVVSMEKRIITGSRGASRWKQDLSFPYYRVDPTSNQNDSTKYNFATADVFNLLTNGSITQINKQYLYRPKDGIIVIPADGWYKIDVAINATLSDYGSTFSAQSYYNSGDCEDGIRTKNMQYTKELLEDCPFELQLVKNYNFNAELIKGKHNVRYLSGDKSESTFQQTGCGYTSNTVPNKIEWVTEFPHQNLYSAYPPTETNAILTTSVGQTSTRSGRNANDAMYGGITEEAPASIRTRTRPRPTSATTVGYVTKDNETMPYDPAVSDAFICGFSSLNGGIVSVMKNGNSWSDLNTTTNDVFARVEGLDFINNSGTTSSNYCKNEYPLSPKNTCSCDGQHITGRVQCSVYLHRNDEIELLGIQRSFQHNSGTNIMYEVTGNIQLYIEASSPKTRDELELKGYNYRTPTEWNDKLELNHWINDEVLTKDWIENILTAFNLQMYQDGNTIVIDTNKSKLSLQRRVAPIYFLNLDDRVSEKDAITSAIDYPRSMKVTYKIDRDEWGFEKSVPQEYIKDWYKYGDSGYTVVKMSNDVYTTKDNNTSTDFSYCWYDVFDYDRGNGIVKYNIPVISKAEYMADGYGYDDAMLNDGYSLTQRFWFRNIKAEPYYLTLNYYDEEKVYINCPVNYYRETAIRQYADDNRESINMSYKDTEKSLLTEYFNFVPMLSSNYVQIKVYLSPQEYSLILKGAFVTFCDGTYYVCEVEGYDPTGNNLTTLKLINAVN